MKLVMVDNQYKTDEEKIECVHCKREYSDNSDGHFHYCEFMKKPVCDRCMHGSTHFCSKTRVVHHPVLWKVKK